MELTPAQCRAGRALVNMSQDQLEAASKVARKTIVDFERESRQPYARTLAAIRQALEAAGVEFIAENGGGAGVRLRQPSQPGSQKAHPGFAATMGNALDAMPERQDAQVKAANVREELRRSKDASDK